MFFLPDPIINVKNFNHSIKVNEKKISEKDYFIAVGRLTEQKNFEYLIDEFQKFLKKNEDFKLLIFGEGGEI